METKTEKKYFVTVGMEVHAELNTMSKMWCSCKNDPFNSDPNQNVCPVCLAEPGALPVANLEALRSIIKVGLAVGGNIANFTEFDRKNYFYPDMPKAYQITQFKYPVVSGGKLAGIELTRIHMEEDTAKSDHEKGSYTLIDFNRAGVPLMELVTEPITYNSKEEAAKASSDFCKEYQRLIRTLGVGDANMEKGQLRLEANMSITLDPKVFGTKCEVKNLNSFNSVEKAIMYEVDRHADMLAKGETILQETRGWNETKMETFSQRKKENANDYRYFPDPDLPKMYLHEIFDIEKMRSDLPELPNVKKEKYLSIGLSEKQIDQLLDDNILGKYYESGIKLLKTNEESKTFSNYLLSDVLGFIAKDNNLILPKAESFTEIITMLSSDKLSSRGAKDLLLNIMENSNKYNTENKSILDIATSLNLIQTVDPEAVKKVVEKVIAENQKEWTEYKAGAVKLEMFFVGKCMKESAGSGNPKAFIEILKSL